MTTSYPFKQITSDLDKYFDCLNYLAFDPNMSKGRNPKNKDEIDDHNNLLGGFLSDYCKILESKALRCLEQKTQVFSLTNRDSLLRTRQSHTNEVASIALKIASLLGLNVNLCLAIALGHDNGHVPFGHAGEKAIGELAGKKFKHAIFSSIRLQQIERGGRGLNLYYETLEGIENHSTGGKKIVSDTCLSAESRVVQIADKVAYIFADANDIMRNNSPVCNLRKLRNKINQFGDTQRQRVLTIIHDVVVNSAKDNKLSFGNSGLSQAFMELKDWMYDNIYHKLDREPHMDLIKNFYKHLEKLISRHKSLKKLDPILLIALTSDPEMMSIHQKIVSNCSLRKDDIVDLNGFKIIQKMDFKYIDMFSSTLW